MSSLLIGHTDGAIEGRVGVAIAGVEQVKYLAGKIEPAVFVKIAGVVLTDLYLEVSLEFRDVGVVRLRCRRKVVRIVIPLFVKVSVDVGHPFVVFYDALLRLHLRLPGPVAIQVKEIVIGTASGPGFPVFAYGRVDIAGGSSYAAVPAGITRITVRVDGWVQDDNGVFQPFLNFGILGIYQIVNYTHT